ncbi:ParA family protein, partial [Burkholderia thailandensis]|uniref:ParA family protein n=1 Tax=Burkholderia thailandensis TaxID=57975 RepID=UPI000473F81F
NSKGGTGKTSLAFQSICRFAELNPHARILAIDVCPQANLSELMLGGLTNQGSARLMQRQGQVPRCSIGGYFQLRLPAPYTRPAFTASDFITTPNQYNPLIPGNIDLVCGDPLLELQANAVNTLANAQIPGTNTWIAVIDWISDFLESAEGYDYVFFDANPSFSIYTQIALSATNRVILPVMADDSSRRAIQNAFSLIYGLRLPSPIYATYNFATKLREAERPLPQVHLIPKNRLTQYMGPASAFYAVLAAIDQDVAGLLVQRPDLFTFADVADGVVDVRDFQTTGVVSYAKGAPFSQLRTGRLDIGGHRVRVDADMRQNCIDAIDGLVDRIE